MPQDRTYGALTLAEIKERIANRTVISWAALDDMADDIARLRSALHEIIAINDESPGVFRKRGGTRRGLSIVAARTALTPPTA